MKIICENCSTAYSIPDNKLPKQKAAGKCKNCGQRITIDPTSSAESLSGDSSAAYEHGAINATAHDTALLEAFPQLADFDPSKYRINEMSLFKSCCRW